MSLDICPGRGERHDALVATGLWFTCFSPFTVGLQWFPWAESVQNQLAGAQQGNVPLGVGNELEGIHLQETTSGWLSSGVFHFSFPACRCSKFPFKLVSLGVPSLSALGSSLLVSPKTGTKKTTKPNMCLGSLLQILRFHSLPLSPELPLKEAIGDAGFGPWGWFGSGSRHLFLWRLIPHSFQPSFFQKTGSVSLGV